MKRTTALVAAACVTLLGLTACSSSSEPAATTSAATTLPADSTDPAAEIGPSQEILDLCDEIVAAAMSDADAAALATERGFTSRVVSIDGEGQAATMDYRIDRMNFDVEGGVVTGCTAG